MASLNTVAGMFGLAGILGSQRELVIFFFTFNAGQVVLTFYFFVDLLFDLKIRFQTGLHDGFERAAAGFLLTFNLLSIGATYFAVKAVHEIKQKQREEYNRISVLPDSLAFGDS